MSRRIRYILFDAVGTLIYPQPPVAEVYAEWGRQFGSSITPDQVRARFGPALARAESRSPASQPEGSFYRPPTSEEGEYHRWQQIVADVFADLPDATGELFEALWRHFAQAKHWAVYDDVVDTWARLEKVGYQPGIASNFDARLVEICRELAPLDRCQHIYYSSQLGYTKPDPRFFAAIAERLEASPGEILLVGDDPLRDTAGAQAAGWQTLEVRRELQISD